MKKIQIVASLGTGKKAVKKLLDKLEISEDDVTVLSPEEIGLKLEKETEPFVLKPNIDFDYLDDKEYISKKTNNRPNKHKNKRPFHK